MARNDIYTNALPPRGIKSPNIALFLHRSRWAKCRASYLVGMLAKANQHAQPVVNLCKMANQPELLRAGNHLYINHVHASKTRSGVSLPVRWYFCYRISVVALYYSVTLNILAINLKYNKVAETNELHWEGKARLLTLPGSGRPSLFRLGLPHLRATRRWHAGGERTVPRWCSEAVLLRWLDRGRWSRIRIPTWRSSPPAAPIPRPRSGTLFPQRSRAPNCCGMPKSSDFHRLLHPPSYPQALVPSSLSSSKFKTTLGLCPRLHRPTLLLITRPQIASPNTAAQRDLPEATSRQTGLRCRSLSVSFLYSIY